MITELDKAAMKHEMRDLYKDVGYLGALETLYEMLVAAQMLLEVLAEEEDEDFNLGEHK